MHQFPVMERLGSITSGLRCLSCHDHAEVGVALSFLTDSDGEALSASSSPMLQSLWNETKHRFLPEWPIAAMRARWANPHIRRARDNLWQKCQMARCNLKYPGAGAK